MLKNFRLRESMMQSIEIYSLSCSILFDFETIPRDEKSLLSSALWLDYLCTTVKPEMNQKKGGEKKNCISRLFFIPSWHSQMSRTIC